MQAKNDGSLRAVLLNWWLTIFTGWILRKRKILAKQSYEFGKCMEIKLLLFTLTTKAVSLRFYRKTSSVLYHVKITH